MGTRSNTVVIETGYDKEFILLNMYRQMDGYLSGHGTELYEFMSNIVMCNGIGIEQDKAIGANGAGCLAAQLVAHFKDGVGGTYIERPLKGNAIGVNDYTYVIRCDTFNPNKGIEVQVFEWGKQIFQGDNTKFGAFLESEKECV